ncbi:hypothetical protein BaRGS_00022464 [Batillaria attramentaria]|uniref:Beta-1,3-galactosyl-O-glycosyl-glycoprotein beta-1,6-N-acetylglucosaminyltransferase n=1 Tax=Batillaria attramentaria TaxID=370345 RepID=A0ABD0KGP7_9CAEN
MPCIPGLPATSRRSRHLAVVMTISVAVLVFNAIGLRFLGFGRRQFPWKQVKDNTVDCSRLIAGDVIELNRALEIQRSASHTRMTDNQVTELALKCDNLKRERSFVTSSLSEEESNFPLAYSILVYRDAEQVLNLLSAIYRPQNFYCIHVDAKAKRSYRQAIAAIADCFPNVFLSSRSVDVRWGRFSVLEPELVCMQDLWNYTHWKYFINLTGQEFPLKTNYELVKILTAYNGANDVRATPSWGHRGRWFGKGPAPHGITPRKGSVHVAVNRDFVDFVLHSHVSKDIQRWCNITGVPDETFFPSLNHNPKLGIKGSFTAKPKYNQPYMARYKQWTSNKYSPNRVPSCAGQKFVRNICILSVGDLPTLDRRPEMFANKFYANYSRFALSCLAEALFNRTRDEYAGLLDIDTRPYQTLSFVKNQVL